MSIVAEHLRYGDVPEPHRHLVVDGVFIAVSVAFSTLALVSAWLFRTGYWKTKRV